MTVIFNRLFRGKYSPRMKVDRLLETYCTMDNGTKAEMLATVASFMKQRGAVTYDSQEYHNIEDLRVDLESTCKPVMKQVEVQHMMF